MSQRIYVAGHQGMVGSSILRSLQLRKEVEVITRSRAELDLCEGSAVDQFFASEKPEVVIMAAARVGGIHANDTYSAEFIYENLAIAMNVTHAAWSLDMTKHEVFEGHEKSHVLQYLGQRGGLGVLSRHRPMGMRC